MSDPENGSGRIGVGWTKGGGDWEETPNTKSRVRGSAPGYLSAPLAECMVTVLYLGGQGGERGGKRVPRSSGLVYLSRQRRDHPLIYSESEIRMGGGAR